MYIYMKMFLNCKGYNDYSGLLFIKDRDIEYLIWEELRIKSKEEIDRCLYYGDWEEMYKIRN